MELAKPGKSGYMWVGEEMLITYYTRTFAFSIENGRCIAVQDCVMDRPDNNLVGAHCVGGSLASGYVPEIQPVVLGARLVFRFGASFLMTEPIEAIKEGPHLGLSEFSIRPPLPTLPEFPLIELPPDCLFDDHD